MSFPQFSIPCIKELRVELTADEGIPCIVFCAIESEDIRYVIRWFDRLFWCCRGMSLSLLEAAFVGTQVLFNLLEESLGCSGGEGFLAPLARSLCLGRNRGVHQRIAYRRSFARTGVLGIFRVRGAYIPRMVFVDHDPRCLLGFLIGYLLAFLSGCLLFGRIRYLLPGDTTVRKTPVLPSGRGWSYRHGLLKGVCCCPGADYNHKVSNTWALQSHASCNALTKHEVTTMSVSTISTRYLRSDFRSVLRSSDLEATAQFMIIVFTH